MDIARLRREYSRESLDEADVDRDPVAQFGKWFDEALKSGLPEPTAMALATVGATLQSWMLEVTNTLTGVGLWKGAA